MVNLFIPERYRQDKAFVLTIIKWLLIGLLIRIIIMPFSMDPDILWINYIPHQLAAYGNWDGYSFARENFSDRVVPTRNPYYPPLTFYLIASFQFLLQKLMPTLKEWFLHYGSWLKAGGGYTIGHVSFGQDEQIFRNLFFLKLPLLFFDFGIGFILLRLASDLKKALFVFKLWMLNPVVLHSAYATGQLDIYPAFFVILAVLLSVHNRPNLAIVSLTFGALIKSYPIILIPLAIVYLGKTIKEMLKLFLICILTLFLFYLPTAITSKGYCILSLFPGGTIGTGSTNILMLIMKALFLLSIIYLIIRAYRQKQGDSVKLNLENYFFLTILFFFVFQPIGLRFYIWATPFLFLQFTKDKQLWKIGLIQLLCLIGLRNNTNALWSGLFMPLHPEFFNSLPSPDSFIAQFINPIYAHKLMYRVFIILTLYMVYRTFKQIRLNYIYGR